MKGNIKKNMKLKKFFLSYNESIRSKVPNLLQCKQIGINEIG